MSTDAAEKLSEFIEKQKEQEFEKIASHYHKDYRVMGIKAMSSAIDNFKSEAQKRNKH